MKALLLLVLCFLSVLAHPKPQTLEKCTAINCKIRQNCRCSSTDNPITDTRNPAPQLVAITFNEAIAQSSYENYWKPLFFNRTNHDGSPVGVTFFVPHEFTDYALVHELYVRGYEIGDYSITKDSNVTYWRSASQKNLEDEFLGQKKIISTLANIPAKDIKGVRTPHLELNGDVSISAYQSSGLSYDNSWPTSLKLFPYTLNYKTSQICEEGKCLSKSHPGFWVLPIISLRGMDGKECDQVSSCKVNGTANQIANWLYSNVRTTNRAPVTLVFDTKWFLSVENSYEGFSAFLDKVKRVDDVFLVTAQDVLDWVQYPVYAKYYKRPKHSRGGSCLNLLCPFQDKQGQDKYMKSCVFCPERYPWKGNPLGKA